MSRPLPIMITASLLAFACGDDGSSDDANPFANPSTSDAATSEAQTSDAQTSHAQTSDGTTAATSAATTSEPPGSTDDGSPTAPPGTDTSDGPSDSSGNPGGGQLGECVGTGAWESCAQYCEAVGDTCVEQGCDGNTAVYYNDVRACVAMTADGFETGPCTDGFAMGGGVSFARCCCAR